LKDIEQKEKDVEDVGRRSYLNGIKFLTYKTIYKPKPVSAKEETRGPKKKTDALKIMTKLESHQMEDNGNYMKNNDTRIMTTEFNEKAKKNANPR
jgi:hypothetical protein